MPTPVVVSRIQNRRGTQTQFNGPAAIYPNGYNGIGGYGSLPGFDSINYPSVLLPGELALCTDSRRMFIGNINAEYIEVPLTVSGGLNLTPVVVQLPPVGVFTAIPTLNYQTTPFTTILYDLTDSLLANWNTPGTTFSRNGEIKITSVLPPFAPIPNAPYPPLTPVNLTDTGTEVNTTGSTISFMAQYSDVPGTQIEILYQHNFVGTITLSTSDIKWIPF